MSFGYKGDTEMRLSQMNGGNQIDRARQFIAEHPDMTPEQFYQEVLLSLGLFEEAYELFPYYNSKQSLDASDWIMTQVEDNLFEEGDPLWATLRDEVYDMVVAGLT
jgi:hypothetical protein